jgi:outer membrane cobalamin receptor
MVRYAFSATFGGNPMQSAAVEVTSDAFGGSLLAAMHARSASDGEDGDGGTIANSGYRNRGAMLRFVRPTDWGRIRTGLFTSIGREVGAPSSDSSRTWYPDERATLATFAADVDSPGAWSALSFRGAVGAYSITTSRDRGTSIESSAVKARDASLRASAERAIGNARLITGADVVGRFNLRASGSIEDADRWNAGAWASWETPLTASARVAAGGRVDHITSSNHGGWFGDRSRRDTALSGFAAITVAPAPRLTTTVQLASGYREPVLSDRYYRGVSGRGFIIGNPDLEPERSLQFDAAARWTGSRSRAALFVYEYRIRDLVERYRSGTDFHFRNRGEARIRGIELELSTKLARDLELLGGASLARGEDRDSGDALDDIGGPVLHASLRWAGPNASAFATASAWARDERPGPVETVRPGSATIDVGAGWRFTPEFEVRLVVRNATDRWYYGSPDAAASFAPGRSVTIGINR